MDPATLTLPMPTEPQAYSISPVGIAFHQDIAEADWRALGAKLGEAGRSVGFMIGDWLNHGEIRGKWGDTLSEAITITGLDRKTLEMYARVSRRVKLETRVSNLSFEMHRKVAHLKDDTEQKKWLKVAAKAQDQGKPLSTRRLAKSILLGRVAKPEEMTVPESDRGKDNVHPHVNRLTAFWRKMKDNGFLESAELEVLEAMQVDIAPVVRMHEELQMRINSLRDKTHANARDFPQAPQGGWFRGP